MCFLYFCQSACLKSNMGTYVGGGGGAGRRIWVVRGWWNEVTVVPIVQVSFIRGVSVSVTRMWSTIEEPWWFVKVGWRFFVR